jgi:hypothetical protein
MTDEWFTYRELGARLNVSPGAVRHKAIRRGWPRRTADDGRTQVRVNLQDIAATSRPGLIEGPPGNGQPDQPPVGPRAGTRTVEALESHIATLKDMVAKAEALADIYRERGDGERHRIDGERARAETERADAEAERDRADSLAIEIHELLAEKSLPVEKGEELAQRAEELRAIVRRMVNRPPWWRRLVG